MHDTDVALVIVVPEPGLPGGRSVLILVATQFIQLPSISRISRAKITACSGIGTYTSLSMILRGNHITNFWSIGSISPNFSTRQIRPNTFTMWMYGGHPPAAVTKRVRNNLCSRLSTAVCEDKHGCHTAYCTSENRSSDN